MHIARRSVAREPGGRAVVADLAKVPGRSALRVLVADDDPIVRSLIRSKIGLLAGEVVEACDGLEAWHLISKETFQLALVDLEMPNLDGFTLIQCIRSHPLTRHMPIIVVTCRDDHAALQRALEAGASSYMTKPLAWSMFNAHVKHLLRLSATAEAAENALRKQCNLVAARQKLSAGLSGELAWRMRRLRDLLDRSAAAPHERDRCEGEARLGHVLANDIGALEVAVEQYSSTLAMLDGMDADDTSRNRLSDLLGEACAVVERDSPSRSIALQIPRNLDFALDCGREALVFALAAAVRSVAPASSQGVTVAANGDAAGGGVVVSIAQVGLASQPRAGDSALHTTADPESAAISRARLLIEAHGGTLELGIGADGLKAARVRLPADRAVSA